MSANDDQIQVDAKSSIKVTLNAKARRTVGSQSRRGLDRGRTHRAAPDRRHTASRVDDGDRLMTSFACHDRVVVVDPHDTYAGQHGEILGIHFGAVTGLAVVTVRLDEAARTDGFYAEQLDFERAHLRVAA